MAAVAAAKIDGDAIVGDVDEAAIEGAITITVVVAILISRRGERSQCGRRTELQRR